MFFLTADRDELILKINELEKRLTKLEGDSYMCTCSFPSFREYRTPVNKVMWMVLDKLGLSLKRHPATSERFTLEDKS